MNTKTVQQNGFKVIGITTRTSNQDEMKGAGKMASLWNRFYAEGFSEKIANKISDEVISVYHDYESDSTGPYSVILGMKVEQSAPLPDGLSMIQIPEQKYQVFTCAQGALPEVVIQGWQTIWSLEKSHEIDRRYTFDLEVYPAVPGGDVKIWIAIK